jgi:pSer/pThr/pTyr-binding forkhead associated (FHA) protein
MQDHYNKDQNNKTPNVQINIQDGINRGDIHINAPVACHYSGDWLYPGQKAFKCILCGKEPFSISYRDESYWCCPYCLNTIKQQESLRSQCTSLKLVFHFGSEEKTVFLFGKRSIQFGRSHRGNNVSFSPHFDEYTPQYNDIVLRVLEPTDDGMQVNRDRSVIISRYHGVFRIHREKRADCLQILDFGTESHGSANGTWINGTKIAPKKWIDIHDRSHIVIAKDRVHGIEGLRLMTRTIQNDRDPRLIDAVIIDRDDGLGGKHKYILVGEQASLGFGTDKAITFRDAPAFFNGKIVVVDASFVFYPESQCLITSDQAADNGSIPLKPGVTMEDGNTRITCLPVNDKEFYTTTD